ncbi:PglL family O-oligosaccharyltransferase [uncultured Neptuniibacter sp.]|uniref:PglL family O-oligosaccharyltransferase n=1 Tax=uncultured Neptuniibacter sp. TaxID=502143 RepID=UPI00260DC192|nr:Wzy polymerase domain-containing protein [uncultured Neptuniibacter sp.]
MTLQLKLEKDSSLQKPQKLFFVLFGILFLLAPFYYQPNLGGEGLYIPHNTSLWIVASWIIAAASFLVYRTEEIILPRYWFGLALLPIGAVITGLIAENNNPIEWLVRLSVIIGGYLFFIALFQFRLTSRHVERSLYIILASGIILATYGCIQIVIGGQNIGFVPISPNHIPVGIFQQINLQASAMATLLVLVYYLVSRPTVRSMGWIVQLTLLIAATVASYMIAISGSRVGLLGASLGLFILFLGRWKLFQHAKKLLILVIIATIAGGLLGSSGLAKTSAKFDRAIGGVEADIRWKVYSISWELFTEKPLIGHGLGSFQKVFQDKRAEKQVNNELSLGNAPRFSHPHNEFIHWLVEGGLLSVIGVIAAIIITFIQLSKDGWQRGAGYASLLLPIALHSQVELPFYISNFHWLLLLFLLFIVNQAGKLKYSTNSISESAQKTLPISIAITLIFTTFLLVRDHTAYAGIVNYYKSRQSAPQHLTTGLNSIYFYDQATYLRLKRNMMVGIRKGDSQNALEFLAWSEYMLKISPQLNLYADRAIAFDFLQEKESRDKEIRIGESIYLNHPMIIKLKKHFETKDGQSNNTTPSINSEKQQSQAQTPASLPESQQSPRN